MTWKCVFALLPFLFIPKISNYPFHDVNKYWINFQLKIFIVRWITQEEQKKNFNEKKTCRRAEKKLTKIKSNISPIKNLIKTALEWRCERVETFLINLPSGSTSHFWNLSGRGSVSFLKLFSLQKNHKNEEKKSNLEQKLHWSEGSVFRFSSSKNNNFLSVSSALGENEYSLRTFQAAERFVIEAIANNLALVFWFLHANKLTIVSLHFCNISSKIEQNQSRFHFSAQSKGVSYNLKAIQVLNVIFIAAPSRFSNSQSCVCFDVSRQSSKRNLRSQR